MEQQKRIEEYKNQKSGIGWKGKREKRFDKHVNAC